MGILKVEDTIFDLEFRAAKLSFLNDRYPDLKLKTDKKNFWTYGSKIVNREFNNFAFISSVYGQYYAHVRLEVFDEHDFEFKNKKEKLIVSSTPTSCHFVSLVSASEDQNRQFIPYEERNWRIEFSKLAFKNKNEEMQKKLEDQALITALAFVKDHSFAKVDYEISRGIDARLEKLLTFS